MGRAVVSVRVLGGKKLAKDLAALAGNVEKKIVRKALKDSAKRHSTQYVVRELLAIRGATQRSGRERLLQLAEYFQNATIKSQGKKGLIRVGPEFPPRDAIGVDPKDKNYWPSAIEYGSPAHGIPAFPYLRPAVDNNQGTEGPAIVSQMKDAVRAEWVKVGENAVPLRA